MGMFDHIKYETECPNCGEDVDGFQSKNGNCVLNNLTVEELVELAHPVFPLIYTSCKNCGTWVEFRVYPPQPIRLELVSDLAATNPEANSRPSNPPEVQS